MALACAGVLLGAVPASAATFDVTDSADTSTFGTLRFALENLTPGGPNTITINVTTDIVVGAINLPTITEPVTIIGPGEGGPRIISPGDGLVISGADIDVRISDLTIEGAPGVGCGVLSTDANLTLERVTVTDFDCSGVSVDGGVFVATDVTTNGNGNGLNYSGYDATDTVTLTRIVADDNDFQGVSVAVLDSTASISDVTTTNSSFVGFFFGSSNSTATISGVRADGSAGYGVTVLADSGSTVNLSDSSAGAAAPALTSPGVGFLIQAIDGSTISAARLTATDNEGGGIELNADESTVNLSASIIEGNGGAGCGCAGGGGISVNTFLPSAFDSIISISGTRVLRNSSDFGAGIFVGQHNGDSTLTISDSVISDNIAADDGGGFYATDVGQGFASGPISFVRTTISGNRAGGYGGGVSIDGFSDADTQPQFLFDSSTISGNVAANGGGIQAYKDDPSGRPGIIRLVNTTVSGNDSPSGAGLLMEPEPGLGGGEFGLSVDHSTIANNIGGGEGLVVTTTDLDLALSHSIFSGNGATDVDWNGLTSVAVRYSLIQNPSGTAVIPAAPGNIVGVDPQLGPLANNGGPTLTHLVAPGSAAYNAGNPAISGSPAYDQRGLARIYQVIDIGAVEWHPALAATGSKPEPEPGLVGLLFVFTGLALVAASRRFAL